MHIDANRIDASPMALVCARSTPSWLPPRLKKPTLKATPESCPAPLEAQSVMLAYAGRVARHGGRAVARRSYMDAAALRTRVAAGEVETARRPARRLARTQRAAGSIGRLFSR